MAKSVIWSDEALQDLEAIASFIARDSRYYAQKVISEIVEKGESLVDFPESGRIVPELSRPEVRECFIYSYRLIYQIQTDAIHILTVFHGRRLMDPSIISL